MKLQIFWMWIISWLLIIIIHAIVIKRYDISSVYSMHFKEEIVNDGNNLFSTGLVYFIATLICHFLSISILRWVILIITFALCVPPLLSFCGLISRHSSNQIENIQKITAFICDFCPLLMSLNIYLSYIK